MSSLRKWIRAELDLFAAVGEGPGSLEGWRDELRSRALKAAEPVIVELCQKTASVPVLFAAALAELKKKSAAATQATSRPSGKSDYLTTAQAAAMANIGKRTLYRLCESGELPHRRIRGTIRVKRSDLVAYLEDSADLLD